MARVIQAEALIEMLATEVPILVDCRYRLTDNSAGYQAYLNGHIPGANYLGLGAELAGPGSKIAGRHPLLSPTQLAATLARIGLTTARPVVAYDDAGGQIAARFWWLCKWAGFGQVALLDGGWQAWLAADGPVTPSQPGEGSSTDFDLAPEPLPLQTDPAMTITSTELKQALQQGDCRLIDARAAIRYRGEEEPMDAVAGHIPGAINHPSSANLDAQLRFLSPAALAELFEPLLAGNKPEQVVHSCGSGVTACHNLFAMELAGLAGSRLFAPSWSGWIAQPGNLYLQGDYGKEGTPLVIDS